MRLYIYVCIPICDEAVHLLGAQVSNCEGNDQASMCLFVSLKALHLPPVIASDPLELSYL
jgi:hypothetical protein